MNNEGSPVRTILHSRNTTLGPYFLSKRLSWPRSELSMSECWLLDDQLNTYINNSAPNTVWPFNLNYPASSTVRPITFDYFNQKGKTCTALLPTCGVRPRCAEHFSPFSLLLCTYATRIRTRELLWRRCAQSLLVHLYEQSPRISCNSAPHPSIFMNRDFASNSPPRGSLLLVASVCADIR